MFRRTVSGIILALLLVNMLTLAFNIQPVEAEGTIYIRADGSIDPPSANITSADNVTYTFTDDNYYYDSIVVERDSIVIDGNGYTLQGIGAEESRGVDLSGRENVTVRNTQISGFLLGIFLSYSSSNCISGNYVANNGIGIWLEYSGWLEFPGNNSVSGNNMANNEDGIYLLHSSNNSFSGNTVANNTIGITLSSGSCYNSVSGNEITANNGAGVVLSYSSHQNIISGNNITANDEYGITFHQGCHNNSLSGNNITNNIYGINLETSSKNSVNGNSITDSYYGVGLGWSSNNSISGNNITANSGFGIGLYSSSNYNIVSGNNVTANNISGIELGYSSKYNSLSGNNITDNGFGVQIIESSDSEFCHNNFVNNVQQVYDYSCDHPDIDPSVNVWDHGYPSGGNYWSDYSGTDLHRGAYQNETGSDGIGDIQYVIDENNTDHYPLTNPLTVQPDMAIVNVSPFKTVVGLGYSLNISVTVANQGDYTETFSVTVYANITVVETQESTLASGNSTNLTFTWNTSQFSYGNCTLRAYAETLPEETDTSDNNFTCSIPVHVGVPGDISGPTVGAYDGTTNMRDINYMILRFNSKPDSLNWNPNADVNNDLVCNMRDIQIAILNFNKHE